MPHPLLSCITSCVCTWARLLQSTEYKIINAHTCSMGTGQWWCEWHGNGTDLGVDVFQTFHHLSEESPDVVWTGDQVPGVYQLSQRLVLTVLHLWSHDSHLTQVSLSHDYWTSHITITRAHLANCMYNSWTQTLCVKASYISSASDAAFFERLPVLFCVHVNKESLDSKEKHLPLIWRVLESSKIESYTYLVRWKKHAFTTLDSSFAC